MTKTHHIYIGADHRGFELKENLKSWLAAQTYQVTDCGNAILDPTDDFPQFAFEVAERVAQSPNHSRGIVVCGSGIGVTIAANKVVGARASLGLNPAMVAKGREDDDMNILVLAADFQTEAESKALLEAFLNTSLDADDRRRRRINQITTYEQHR